MAGGTFLIGYNRLWRAAFFVFGIYILLSSGFFLVQSLQGQSGGLTLPISVLLAAIFVGGYMLPLVMTPQQRLDVTSDGIKLYGEHSDVVLAWSSVQDVRFKRVMLFMPYLIIALSDKTAFADFLDDNPRSFLAKWTAHVSVMRRYPFILRWFFSVPKTMTTLTMLGWLERRYGGVLVIDVAAANGRAKELRALLLKREI